MDIRAIAKKIGEGAAVLAAITGVAWLNANMPKVEYIPIDNDDNDIAGNYYGKAVSAVMKSNLISYQKNDVVEKLPKYISLSTYEAIKSILDSNAFGYNKISMIEAVTRN